MSSRTTQSCSAKASMKPTRSRCFEILRKGVTDEFVVPFVCDAENRVNENDSVIFFNFRPDRAREITRVL